jgi:hypothetical protein
MSLINAAIEKKDSEEQLLPYLEKIKVEVRDLIAKLMIASETLDDPALLNASYKAAKSLEEILTNISLLKHGIEVKDPEAMDFVKNDERYTEMLLLTSDLLESGAKFIEL